VYVPDPPLAPAKIDVDWPTSTGFGLAIDETTSEVLTVTVTMLEVAVTGVPELSITCSSKLQVPVVVRVPVDTVGVLPAMQLNELPRLA